MPRVTVIDYGIGNLLSVARAFEHCGADVVLTDDEMLIAKADYLVLPGVGSFADGMAGLRELKLIDSIKEYVAKDRPFLGICLGMQMMLDESEEFGANEGLGLIHGKVVSIPAAGENGTSHKIPHIGWNELAVPKGRSWAGTILAGLPEDTATYFVHSFTAVPDNNEHRLADAFYNGRLISAAINYDNIFGTQFHPEKSGEAGLKIVANFLKL
jgi:glutamine amidotransferase